MIKSFFIALCILLGINLSGSFAQDKKPVKKEGAELDSLRKLQEAAEDSVIFNSKYIRYTNLSLLADSTQ